VSVQALGSALAASGALVSVFGASFGGEQSKQTKVVLPKRRLKEPWLLDLWMPHLMQLMVSPVRPSVPKGEPPVLDLYLSPSLEILVLSSRAIVSLMFSIEG